MAQNILDSIPSERRLDMINDFWLALRLIPKAKMDLLKRMFSKRGFGQVLYELKRPAVIQFLVELVPYLVCFSFIIYSTAFPLTDFLS
jgi:hypothetical protein